MSYNQTPSTFTAGPEAYRMKRWALPRIETLAKGSTSSSKMVVDVTIPGSNIHPYISLISQKHFWHFWRDFPLIRPCSWSLEIGLNCRCVGGWKDGADGDLLFSLKMSVMAWSTFFMLSSTWSWYHTWWQRTQLKTPLSALLFVWPNKQLPRKVSSNANKMVQPNLRLLTALILPFIVFGRLSSSC